MAFDISVFPNNHGGVRFMMQEASSRRVVRQGELEGEGDITEGVIADRFPELSQSDRVKLLELMSRVGASWYPEKLSLA